MPSPAENLAFELEVIFCVQGVLSPPLKQPRCWTIWTRNGAARPPLLPLRRRLQHLCPQSPRRASGHGKRLSVPDDRLQAQGQRGEERGGSTGERKFLGFSISNDGSRRGASPPKALHSSRQRIRELTCGRWHQLAADRSRSWRAYLIGWRGYFGFCQTPSCCATWTRGSVEDCACISGGSGRTGEPLHGTASPGRVQSSWRRVAAGSARVLAHVSDIRRCNMALRNADFDSLGLPRLACPQDAQPVEPPWYGPVCPVVWEGWSREASPYPDH